MASCTGIRWLISGPATIHLLQSALGSSANPVGSASPLWMMALLVHGLNVWPRQRSLLWACGQHSFLCETLWLCMDAYSQELSYASYVNWKPPGIFDIVVCKRDRGLALSVLHGTDQDSFPEWAYHKKHNQHHVQCHMPEQELWSTSLQRLELVTQIPHSSSLGMLFLLV